MDALIACLKVLVRIVVRCATVSEHGVPNGGGWRLLSQGGLRYTSLECQLHSQAPNLTFAWRNIVRYWQSPLHHNLKKKTICGPVWSDLPSLVLRLLILACFNNHKSLSSTWLAW